MGALCCAGEACCSCLCGCCMRCCSTSHKQHMRLGYLVIMILAAFFGMIFLYYGDEIMSPWTKFGFADCSGSEKNICLGVQTIYRESFTLVLFYIIMLGLSIPGGRMSAIINQGCWLMKAIIITVLFIITFFIDNAFFDVYREISRYVSVAFLVMQIIVIIDFAYTWNDTWLENYENASESGYWSFCLFFFSGLMWVIALTTIVLSYYWFTTDSGCELNIFLISLTLALGIIFTGLSLTGIVEHGSLLTSSAVNLYCVYLCLIGMASSSSSCNSWNDKASTAITIVLGLIAALVMLLYVTFRKREAKDEQAPIRGVAEAVLAEEDDANEAVPYKEEEDANESPSKMVYFHLLMILTSIYFAMLLTNWGAAHTGGASYDHNEGSMWVNFSALWFTVLLYIWSLLAPKICTGRDFS